ncbi:unnamed protein product, partial [Prorocentrum cordatum]
PHRAEACPKPSILPPPSPSTACHRAASGHGLPGGARVSSPPPRRRRRRWGGSCKAQDVTAGQSRTSWIAQGVRLREPREEMSCREGCLAALSRGGPSRAALRPRPLRGASSEESKPGRTPAADEPAAELRRLVQEGLVNQMAEMRSALSAEVQGMVARLDSLADGSRAPSPQAP